MRKLGRKTAQRKAMLRGMVTLLLECGKIETTYTRAQEVSAKAEEMITLGKKGTLAAYRDALAYITKEDVAKKVFSTLAPIYANVEGGYTQIFKMGCCRRFGNVCIVTYGKQGLAIVSVGGCILLEVNCGKLRYRDECAARYVCYRLGNGYRVVGSILGSLVCSRAVKKGNGYAVFVILVKNAFLCGEFSLVVFNNLNLKCLKSRHTGKS